MNETQTGRPQRSKLKINIKEDKNESKSERIPFTKSTFNNKCQESEKSKLVKNKENKEITKSAYQRPKTTSKDKDQVVDEVETANRPVTPPPENNEPTAPLTPTANLKMLFSAVSPEIRNRDKKNDMQNETKDDEEDNSTESLEIDIDLPSSQEAEWKPGSRKEKSLGLLCQKFLQKYPEYPDPSYRGFICLDEVAKELNVERRRIYDIVNVLESVEIVSRMAKNKYAWHGKTNIVYTLAKLKALGEAEGYAEQMRQLRDYELNRELEEQNGFKTKPPFHDLDESESNKEGYFAKAAMRKDRSLGIMSQKFLMLFLVSQPKTVNLDLSAKILIGDANIDRTENGKFKTKIRRLYDIANILTSLDLIRKVHVTEIRGRKPAFRYIGPDVDNMKDINVCYNDGYHRPSSRHSLLDCVKNHNVADLVSTYKSKASTQATEFPNTSKGFSRHSSFEQICQVAENEIIKMNASMSLPASPTESSASIDDFPRSLSQEEPSSAKNKSKKVS
ncbi:LOW QUALITY PROTEIN: hypothetical protein KUTeg_007927 [Tegillarca granosa]|uniref:E2F/DP family winged-helix DNA-binding domain-containing protein n=1 Tax=Tegillarca granosa TaxID=220873 RepID=A0ABQ9FIL8_TEGGR|nr:LOW QUALITY PROTEIN: hypothetical protein KUTeg_007927 [Tegillarca granosa]